MSSIKHATTTLLLTAALTASTLVHLSSAQSQQQQQRLRRASTHSNNKNTNNNNNNIPRKEEEVFKINEKKEAEVNPDIVTVGYEKIAKTYYARKGSDKGGSMSYSKGKGKSKSKGKGGKGGSKSKGSKSKGKGGSKTKTTGKSKSDSKSTSKSSSGKGSKSKSTSQTDKASQSPSISSAPSEQPSAAPVLAPVASPSASPSALPSNGPTAAPVPSPSAAPTYPCGVDPLTRRDMIFDVLTPEVVSGSTINDVGSSANLAFEWLVGDDLYYICPDDPKLIQRYVMGKIYFQMGGNDWLQCSRPSTSSDNKPSCDVPPGKGYEGTEWLDGSAQECDWAYVKCNADQCITHIEVDENFVTGTLVDEVNWLMFLQVYTMDGNPNEIVGTIPTQFGNLTDLRILDLDENALTGTVPEEIYITAKGLEQLDVDSNQLTGTISTLVGTLTSMTFLQYFSNPMTGTIPSEIGNLKEVTTLGLYDMDLTGEVAAEICANREPAGKIGFLVTDCGTDEGGTTPPQVVCDCCTGCFTG